VNKYNFNNIKMHGTNMKKKHPTSIYGSEGIKISKILHCLLLSHITSYVGSSVGIVTDYGLDGPGSNPGGDEIFRLSSPALGPTQPPVRWVLGLSWG